MAPLCVKVSISGAKEKNQRFDFVILDKTNKILEKDHSQVVNDELGLAFVISDDQLKDAVRFVIMTPDEAKDLNEGDICSK
ncbi:MAG: hypothetical protein ACI304_00740 [Lepagella sp.]